MIVTNPRSESSLQLRTCPTCNHNNNFDQVLDISGSRIKPPVLAYLAAIPLRFLMIAYHMVHFFLGLMLVGGIFFYTYKVYSDVSAVISKTNDEANNFGLASRVVAIDNGGALLLFTFLGILFYQWLRKNWSNFGHISSNAFPFKHLYRLIKEEKRYLRCNHCGDIHPEVSMVDFFPFVSCENDEGSPVFNTDPLYLNPKDNYKFYQENRKQMGTVLTTVKRRIHTKGITDFNSLMNIVEDEDLLRQLRDLYLAPFVYAPELLWLMIYEFSDSDHIRHYVLKCRVLYYSRCKIKVNAVNAEINCDMDFARALDEFHSLSAPAEKKPSGRKRKVTE